MNAWLAIGAAGLVAYAMRLSVPVLASRRSVPAVAVELSRLAAPAAIAALLASSLVSGHDGGVQIRDLAALAVGLTVAARTRSMPRTFAAGLVAYAVAGVLP